MSQMGSHSSPFIVCAITSSTDIGMEFCELFIQLLNIEPRLETFSLYITYFLLILWEIHIIHPDPVDLPVPPHPPFTPAGSLPAKKKEQKWTKI